MEYDSDGHQQRPRDTWDMFPKWLFYLPCSNGTDIYMGDRCHDFANRSW